MTKKHYEAAAAQVRALYPEQARQDNRAIEQRIMARLVEDEFVKLFMRFESRFDAERFRAAARKDRVDDAPTHRHVNDPSRWRR